MRVLSSVLLLLCLASACLGATTAIPASKDGDVRRDSPTYISGFNQYVYVGDSQSQEQSCWGCGLFWLDTCCDPPYTVFRERILYTAFDLNSVSGQCLQSATLELRRSSGSIPTGSSNFVYLRLTQSSWSEGSLSWNNRGSLAPVIQESPSQFFQVQGSNTYTLNVPLSFLEAALAGNKVLSLQVELNNGGSSDVMTEFYSSDTSTASNKPTLRVQFATCGANSYCSAGTCPCLSGFELEGGACVDIDDCDVTPAPCANGVCSNDGPGTGRVNCTCSPGWQGPTCNQDIDECSLNYCGSNARNCTNTPGGYTCTCSPFWTGQRCNQDVKECASSPCVHGACIERIGANFSCSCEQGFYGDLCQFTFNGGSGCTEDACQNGGTCNPGNTTVPCTCVDGYSGYLCETNIDDCPAINPCQNGGVCVDNSTTVNAYTCLCVQGYGGVHCENDINYCEISTKSPPCDNGGECRDGNITYTCSCPAGFEGVYCEKDIDECSFAPCVNGNCANTEGSFVCSCITGWGGTLCDTAIFCEPENDVENTNWPRTRAGATAQGICADGFQGAASSSRACNQPPGNGLFGVWGTVNAGCTARKCPALTTQRTLWPATDAGDNSTGTCQGGYASNATNPVRFCSLEGTFSVEIIEPCTPIRCLPTSLNNANFSSTDAGKTATGVCMEGFAGVPKLNCTLDGTWATELNANAICTSATTTCPPVYVGEFLQFGRTQAGVKATGECPPGTKPPTGKIERQCGGNGIWESTVGTCEELPGPVVNLTASQRTARSVNLTWTPGPRSDMFRISLSSDGGKTFSVVSNGAGNNWRGTSFIVDFLTPYTQYIFRVQGGRLQDLYEDSGTLLAVTTSLPDVELLGSGISNVTNTSVLITWVRKAESKVEWVNIYARYVPPDTAESSKRSAGITSTEFTLVDGGLKSTETSYNFTDLEYATYYEAMIISGRTENDNDIFDDVGLIIAFNTAGVVSPTQPPTDAPTTPEPEKASLIPAIAGGVAGAVVLILFVIILIAFYVRSKRKEKELYELQMADLPPSSWGPSSTSLIDRAGGTKTLTRTHTLTRPTMPDVVSQEGVTIHSMASAHSAFGAEPTLMNTIMEISLPGFLLLDYAKDLRIQNRFGNGGSGVVYRAVLLDPKLRKQHGVEEVAIKEVVAWEKLTETENMERFHQEVSLLWSLSFHPNIATLIGYTDSPPTIVTKLYETDLFQFLQNPDEDITTEVSVMLAAQIAAGLTAMHNIGIIHRDVKSANVLLEAANTANGVLLNACICDFGLARVTAASGLFNQKFSTVVGLSPRYAAPEVFARSHLPTLVPDTEEEKKADVFAFGVVVWELLTRDVPWDDSPNEQIEVKVRSGQRLAIPPANGDPLRQMLGDLCAMTWQEQPYKRPSIQDIGARLSAISL